MGRPWMWLFAVAAAMTALVPPAAARSVGWGDLHRPLHLPRLAPGAACPVSHVDRSFDFERLGVAKGIGPGPAYPLLSRGVLFLAPAASYGSRVWAGNKVMWLVDSHYAGPVLVRGRRLDGAGLVRFDRGNVPVAELRIPPGAAALGRPGDTRLRMPGCYAYQIDGTSFSRVVVFRAVQP